VFLIYFLPSQELAASSGYQCWMEFSVEQIDEGFYSKTLLFCGGKEPKEVHLLNSKILKNVF
jgi:hypothetical protein